MTMTKGSILCSLYEHKYLLLINRLYFDFLFVDVFRALKNVGEGKNFIRDL